MSVYEIKGLNRLELDELLVVTVLADPFFDNNKALQPFIKSFKDVVGSSVSSEAAIKWFVTNVARTTRNKGTALSVKLSRGYWSGNDCGIGYRGVKSLVDWLEENGYVDIYRGFTEFWKPVKERRSQSTILKFKEPLLELFVSVPLHLFVKAGTLENEIVNRSRETKELLSTRSIRNVKEARNKMKEYNKSLSEADIKFKGEPVATVEYFRSFSGDSDSGGRLYVNGGGIQLVAERFRSKYLTFNDEPVVELDYSSNHPNILYEYKELDSEICLRKMLGEDFKPYDADLHFVDVDEIEVANHKTEFGIKEYCPLRNLCKIALLVSLNCGSILSAAQALRNEIYKDRKSNKEDQKFVGIIGSVNTRKVCMAISEHNYVISEYFFRDEGISLQNIDSEIALGVVDALIQNGETVLCYHDSFIVREGAESLLRAAMRESWSNFIGGDKFCKIDKK